MMLTDYFFNTLTLLSAEKSRENPLKNLKKNLKNSALRAKHNKHVAAQQ